MKRNALSLTSKRVAVAALVALTATWSCTPALRAAVALESSDSQVASWDAQKNGESYVFTFNVSGDPSSLGTRQIAISYADGQDHAPQNEVRINTWNGSYQVVNSWWAAIEGASCTASGSTLTVSVPASYFANDNFTASFGGASITSAQMGGGSSTGSTETPGTGDAGTSGDASGDSTGSGDSGNAGSSESGSGTDGTGGTTGSGTTDGSGSTSTPETGDAAYTGIKIDGNFDDWDGVPKYDVDEGKGWSTVDRLAMVWDGDWVYLYFESNSDDAGAVTGAGPNNNGQFAITTDLGNQTLIQLNRDYTVSGISGAQVAVNNKNWGEKPHKWEVAIPASELGNYSKTISFGMYQVDPAITGVANLQADSNGKDFSGITYDGKYDDWDGYPHTTIQYATSGTGEHKVDAQAALYADSQAQKLYGHVVTEMPQHLEEAGGEFTSAVSIKINDDTDLMVTPRFVAVDAAGNIDWSPDLSKLANGTYEFYLFSTTNWGTSTNINNLNENDVCYGKATITIADGKDEMEWEMDIPTLAANLHANWGQNPDANPIDADSIKEFAAQYGRIGQEWVKTAGTSTAPAIGIGLCMATVGGTVLYRRRKEQGSDAGPGNPAGTEAAA